MPVPAKRRISLWLAVPIVLACGGIGAAVGLLAPPDAALWRSIVPDETSDGPTTTTAPPPRSAPARGATGVAPSAAEPQTKLTSPQAGPPEAEDRVQPAAVTTPASPPPEEKAAADSRKMVGRPAVGQGEGDAPAREPGAGKGVDIGQAAAVAATGPVPDDEEPRRAVKDGARPAPVARGESVKREARSGKDGEETGRRRQRTVRSENRRDTREPRAEQDAPPERERRSKPLITQIPIVGPVVDLLIP